MQHLGQVIEGPKKIKLWQQDKPKLGNTWPKTKHAGTPLSVMLTFRNHC